MAAINLQCPHCCSENTQKLSLLVENGTTYSETSSLGVVRGHIGYASSRGIAKNELALKYARPGKPGWGLVPYGFLLVAGWFIIALTISFVMILNAFFFLAITLPFALKKRRQIEEYPDRLAEWNASFICYRCEEVFTSTAGDTVMRPRFGQRAA